MDKYAKLRIKILSQEPVNKSKLRDLSLKMGISFPTDPHVVDIAIHKMRLASIGIPKELSEKSKQWLLENGYSLELF